MRIVLFGYGKMGQLIEQLAIGKGHVIIARFSCRSEICEEHRQQIAQADIAIDFSHASLVLRNLELCLRLDKPLVIGTTGWEEQLEHAQQMVQQANGSCLFAPNFSIGIYLFQSIIAYAASLF